MTQKNDAWGRKEEVLEQYRKGVPLQELCAAFGVSKVLLHRMLRTWEVRPTGRMPRGQALTIPTDPAILGYIAGILDGEGSVTIVHQKCRMQPNVMISIASTTAELHEWLCATLGGRSFERRINHLGTKPVWYWQIGASRDVQALLQAILPYMIIKRAKAQEALSIIERALLRRSEE